MRIKKLEKICCEICGNNEKTVLHNHHVVERTELETNNDHTNLVCLCSNCHNKIHGDIVKVVGLFNSTKLPYKRTLVYIENGICNVPGMENEKSYYKLKPESMKV